MGKNRFDGYSAWFFIALRAMIYLALPLAGLVGYGDLSHFFNLSGLGWPFFDYWNEFPPVFPFLSRLLYLISAGQEHIYDYLLIFLLTIIQAANLGLFIRLNRRLHPGGGSGWRAQLYFLILLVLSYGWWYFDSIAVFFMLLGLLWVLEGKDRAAGLAIGLGILTKLFPGIILVVTWVARPRKRALQTTLISIALVVFVYGSLFLVSPDLTAASLRSQIGKGSWETTWALLDGNLSTGNFGELAQRFDPTQAGHLMGNPPVVSPWLVLIPFVLLGGWLFIRFRSTAPIAYVSFLGLAWMIFLLWSPGWSPQWVLYLLPLVLLILPQREAILMSVSLVLVNLLEWPVLLSRGLNSSLWLTILLRTLLFLLLAYSFWKMSRQTFEQPPEDEGWKTVEFQ